MPATTRGPLPAAVYWRRRLAVLSVALVVVLGLGKVLDLGSDGSSQDAGAEQAGAATLASPTATVTSAPEPSAKGGKGGKGGRGGKGGKGGNGGNGGGAASTAASPTTPAAPPSPVLPDPTGPCSDADVFITPSVTSPVGGSDVTITLNLQTRTSPACTWALSPETMRLDIVSGPDEIWLSRQCPDAIASQQVVVRLASVTQVPVVWNARRSDDGCTGRTAWALPGFYHARAAVLGGEPTDVQFELLAPAPPTVTQTVAPDATDQQPDRE